jgi:glyoxylase-like metal-dependent hydrolase (beta-lactamase superfamily II)
MRHHGVPDAVIDGNEHFWNFIRRTSDAWTTDQRLADGDVIRAGGRELRAVARPGHSTTDTLFVDEREGIAFVGDHLLASISSNTEVYPAAEPDGTRPRARVEYLDSLRRTAAMPLELLLSGHGDPIDAHAELVARRLEDHDRRCERILAALEPGPASAWTIATKLWSARTVNEQPLLVVWEVLGHLDLLLDVAAVEEEVTQDGSPHGKAHFSLLPRNNDPTGGGGRARASRHAHGLHAR